jgi:serine/threonine protein kinase
MHRIVVCSLLWNGLCRYFFEIDHLVYYIFSMEGGELFNRIRDRQDKPYTEREAANVIFMIAKAVAHLHHMDMVRIYSFIVAFLTFCFDL